MLSGCVPHLQNGTTGWWSICPFDIEIVLDLPALFPQVVATWNAMLAHEVDEKLPFFTRFVGDLR